MKTKEYYFAPGHIEEKAAEFLAPLSPLRKRHNLAVDIDRAALLVLDMQNYFFAETSHAHIPSMKSIVPGIKRLQEFFVSRGRPVIQTRHINNESDAGQMKQWWRELIKEDNPLSQIIQGLNEPAAHVLEKSQYDAFYETCLMDYLTERDVEQVMVTGVMTHLCCETTARSAFVRGFQVYFGVDTTATYNSAFHQATLMNLAHGFAVPILESEVIQIRGSEA